jgi:hypothetical protein
MGLSGVPAGSGAEDAEEAAAEEDPGAQHEPEVVPVAVVVDLVEAHVLGEERDEEGDRRDDPVP